ncbi:G-protein coupled receptor family C group 6 member A-like [Centropristis striata]|uniref:G-protein coupled receptor family C group 6 member A-like n=1 Tax=Centropristis striata TaxID=184440 RepID=UPI0027DEB88D|nr:G-protein coupled receptor family C group 6 member A-like [Centropristis striata]
MLTGHQLMFDRERNQCIHVFYLCVSMMFLLCLFVSIMSIFCSCSGDIGLLHAYSPGDVIIGGLFPIHLKSNRSESPTPLSCSDYDIRMFLRTQVMIYAIREVNERTPRVLPNITLGYDIYDTCGDVTFAIRATLQLLKDQSDPKSCLVPPNFQSALSEPNTKAVIGERYSEVSIAVARVVALSSVAQISYASTSEQLSRKLKFPTFLRTIPSDEYQTKAMAELVKKFNWKTVAIIGSDDEYGKYGSDKLVTFISEIKDICIEFVDILPGYFSRNISQSYDRLNELLVNINKSSAEAIIVFTKETNVAFLMEAATKYRLNRTWIASDSWSTSSKVSALPGIEMAGEVFGFISKRKVVPGFEDYVMSMFNGTSNAILQHYLTQYPLCSNHSEEDRETNCPLPNSFQCLNPRSLAKCIDQDESYNIYLAVQVIVEGLRRLLKCDNHRCERTNKFTALELLMEIKKVNFTVNTTHIFFDSNGDPLSLAYDIVRWNMTDTKQPACIKTIGEYWPDEKDGRIKVPDDLARNMRNVTVYNCYKTCEPGHELQKKKNKPCCNDCVQCEDGDFSPGNGEGCKHCSQKEYSTPQRDGCLKKKEKFLEWSDYFVIFLSFLGVFGIIVTIVFAVLFTIYRRTPIVKAVGGYLCFLELFSLLACFCSTFSFAGKPTDASCKVGLPLFGIVFSLCISCILANLLQILVGFHFDLKAGSWVKRLNQPLAVVVTVTGIQLALCVSWLCYYPPTHHEVNSNKTLDQRCQKGSDLFFVGMLGYNAFLALICFLFAFKGKQLPDLYKNARLITVSMLLYLIVWIFFIPIYIKKFGTDQRGIESAAILISTYSILGCHLAPKCYIMVFRKEINNQNAITEHIRKHYEQRGMAVVKS